MAEIYIRICADIVDSITHNVRQGWQYWCETVVHSILVFQVSNCRPVSLYAFAGFRGRFRTLRFVSCTLREISLPHPPTCYRTLLKRVGSARKVLIRSTESCIIQSFCDAVAYVGSSIFSDGVDAYRHNVLKGSTSARQSDAHSRVPL